MKAYLQLENGAVFEGNAFGSVEESIGEVVFNTRMAGYQELITDPSSYGQIVVMTYPLIGNYGINLEDNFSDGPKIKGLILREKSNHPSNFRCELDLDGYLKYNGVAGIDSIDTRALTKMIRKEGALRGLITYRQLPTSKLREKLDLYDNTNAVDKVSTKDIYTIEGSGKHLGILDYGITENILSYFKEKDLKMTVFPGNTLSEEILSRSLDGIFLSDGPGNPKDYPEIIKNIKPILKKKAAMGISLGHQFIALALGGDISKLHYGHRGVNHPVKDIDKNKIYTTTQNHGYAVSKIPEEMVVSHTNINDNTIEGLRHKSKQILSIQFHPALGPSPDDSHKIIDKFIELL